MSSSHLLGLQFKRMRTQLKTHTINLKTCPETLKTLSTVPANFCTLQPSIIHYSEIKICLAKISAKNILRSVSIFFLKNAQCAKKRAAPSTPALWPTFHQTKEPICWKTEISTKWVIWCQLCFSKRGTALQILTTQLVHMTNFVNWTARPEVSQYLGSMVSIVNKI